MPSALLSFLLLFPLRGQESCQKRVGIPDRGRSAQKYRMRFFTSLIVLGSLAGAYAQSPDQITADILIARSPVIALIEVSGAGEPRMNDASAELSIHKQRAQARCIKTVRGEPPKIFIIENERDSVLTDGPHLAFLRPLSDKRYILSTPVSLRRVKGDKAFWFHSEYKAIREIVAEIELSGIKNK